jgi:peptidoglycan/xylan/chitin deacetylase (PgdA/CDA1 family)
MGVSKKALFFIGFLLLIISVIISIKLYDTNTSLLKQLDNQVKQYEGLKEESQMLTNQNKQLQNQIDELKKEIKDLEDEKGKLEKTIATNSKKNKNESDSKIVYLTFDDGPSLNTPKVLDILKENNINATFFVNGNSTDFGKEMYKRIVDEGNAIGNHTYSHDYKTIYSSIEEYIADTKRLEELLYNTTGIKPNIIRFPGGSNNHVSWQYSGQDFMKLLTKKMVDEGYQYFDWNVSSSDAEVITQDKNKIVNSVLNSVKGKQSAIILFHDSKPKTTTVEALPEIISKLKKEGYKFKILTEDSPAIRFN